METNIIDATIKRRNRLNALNSLLYDLMLSRGTRYDLARLDSVDDILANDTSDGYNGAITEILLAGARSRKFTVSPSGKADIVIYYNGKRYTCEAKTNGGRIDNLLSGKDKHFVYAMCLTNKSTSGLTRIVLPIFFPDAQIFLDLLRECNAIKENRHNGEVRGYSIQASSKKLYEALASGEYGLPFFPDLDIDEI